MISMIVCMDKNGLIGKDNVLPWNLPSDLKYFKQKTTNQICVMGRNTFESIIERNGKPLPDRDNLVLSRWPISFKREWDRVWRVDQGHILKLNRDYPEKEIFIIGGASVYEFFLYHATTLYITKILAEFEGDTHFPEIDYAKWEEIITVGDNPILYDEKADLSYKFITLKRVR